MLKLYLLITFLSLHQLCRSQDHTTTILQNIRHQYQSIHANKSSYRKVSQQTTETADGGDLTGYFRKDSIKLMEECIYAEGGKQLTFIYYQYAIPVFILTQEYIYNVPYYVSSFDIKRAKIKEHRAYFYNGKMIRWINEQKKTLSNRDTAYIQKEQSALNTASELYTRVLAADTIKNIPPPVRR
jgi:hypothetical protein